MPRRLIPSSQPRIKSEQLHGPPSPFKTILPDNNETRVELNGIDHNMEVTRNDLDSIKYLHKKFKKVATLEEVSPGKTEESAEIRSESPGGRYVCPYCKLACAKPSVLQKHIRAHTNERPYPCHPCGFAFKTKSNLYKHCRSRAHTLKMDVTDCSADPSSEDDEHSEILVPAKKIYKPKFHNLGDTEDSGESVGSGPEILQKHINKLLTDSNSIDKNSEPYHSKLALALLRPQRSPEPGESQPLNLSQKESQDKTHTIDGSLIKDILIKARAGLNGFSHKDEPVKCHNCNILVDKLDVHLRVCKGPTVEESLSENNFPSSKQIDPYEKVSKKRRLISPLSLKVSDESPWSPYKSVKLYGGEVQILDTPGGETRTLRIDSNQETNSSFIDSLPIARISDQKESQILTISKAGLHSVRGTMIEADTLTTNTYSTKMSLPMISTPSISIPGVPPLPFPPSINPLTSITGYNPLTLPESAGLMTIVHGGKTIPHVPGMPGPNSLFNSSLVPTPNESSVIVKGPLTSSPLGESIHKSEAHTSSLNVPMQLQPEPQYLKKPRLSIESTAQLREKSPVEKKFVRPSSLPLKQGTYVTKKHAPAPAALVSPETPRPRKSYGQLYLNGHAYTYLGLKCSTRMFFCTLNKPQPIYVPLTPEHSKVSMYSNWKVCSESALSPVGMSPSCAMSSYDSRNRSTSYTLANRNNQDLIVHSSYSSEKIMSLLKTDSMTEEIDKKRIKICDGGYESNEDYIYVRGRGRGKYVCEECGIRCKKPSMLKKHIRTHTDVRPYICRYCAFSFKTKGNLTKHMKSKAHYRRCVELDISPVPVVVDESNIDRNCLAKQEALRAERGVEGSSEESEEEDDSDEDEDDESDDEEEGKMEREAAASLLSLSKVAIQSAMQDYVKLGLIAANFRPHSYPYTSKVENKMSPFVENLSVSPQPVESRADKIASDSTFPMDLSNKTIDGGRSPSSNESASILATIASTTELLAGTPASSVGTPDPSEESVLLHAYLKEKAARETQIKQHQYKEVSVIKERVEESNEVVENPAKESALGILALTSSQAAKSPSLLPPVQSKQKAEFMPPANCPSYSTLPDGRSVCKICTKVFTKPSQLRLHINIHYFERPFRCEACAVSFRTKGHLQKHQRSLSHLNKVNMNSTFGTATSSNPRPFKCDDCKIAFRIHGHLAKHLRSKMHIMRLECLGKLPFGMYAELERSGLNLNDIDTTDCENSLESLQLLAQRLHEKDPTKLGQWAPPESSSTPQLNMMSCGETSSDEDEPRATNQEER